MIIQIASDLHLEALKPSHLPGPDAFRPAAERDLLVLAGDIGTGTLAREFIESELERSPVIYVPGNHEYYGKQPRAVIEADWRKLADGRDNLHYLLAEGVEINGMRFWGAPWFSDLWGDYKRLCSDDPWRVARFQKSVVDFHRRCNADGEWTLSTHVAAHIEQTSLLERQAGQADVVITHWPPTLEAIHPKFEGDAMNPYFINDHEDLVRAIGAKLWISGHTHEAYDYRVGRTRCIGNPTGYQGEDRQSRLFRPDRVVTV